MTMDWEVDNREEHRMKTPNDNSRRTDNELWPRLVECKGCNLGGVEICKIKNKRPSGRSWKSTPLWRCSILFHHLDESDTHMGVLLLRKERKPEEFI
jgi:hypothetical protein